MHLFEVSELALDNKLGHALDSVRNIREQSGLLVGIEQIEEGARLAVIVVSFAMVIAIGVPADLQRGFGEFGTIDRSVERVRLVICIGVRIVCEKSHLTVLVIVMHGPLGCVYRQSFVVSAEAMPMRVCVSEDASLQHLVGREADPGNNIVGLERCLFDFCKI